MKEKQQLEMQLKEKQEKQKKIQNQEKPASYYTIQHQIQEKDHIIVLILPISYQ